MPVSLPWHWYELVLMLVLVRPAGAVLCCAMLCCAVCVWRCYSHLLPMLLCHCLPTVIGTLTIQSGSCLVMPCKLEIYAPSNPPPLILRVCPVCHAPTAAAAAAAAAAPVQLCTVRDV